jgi:hypothetical protein
MKRDIVLWFAAVVGPVAWFADLLISYAVIPGPHRPRDAGPLLAISAVALVLGGAGLLIAWRALREREVSSAPRPRFLAHSGIALSVLSMALVIATALPTLMLIPGGEP